MSLPSITIAVVSSVCCMIIISLISNTLVCITFILNRQVRLIPNYFIISLAISDLLVTLYGMPHYIIELLQWNVLSKTTRKIWVMFDIFLAAASIVNLAAMSLERLLAICHPVKHINWITPRRTVLLVIVSWLYAFVLSLTRWIPVFAGSYMTFIVIVCIGIPMLIISASYICIFIKVKFKMAAGNQASKDNVKLAVMVFVIVITFVVCWIPFFATSLLWNYHCVKNPCPFFATLAPVGKCMHYFNSCCNPFIYAVLNTKFRAAIKDTMKKCICRCEINFMPERRVYQVQEQ